MDDKRDVSTLSDDDLDRAVTGAKPVSKSKRKSGTPEPEADASAPPDALPPTFGAQRKAAMERLARRASGKERPVPLPWKTLAAQLGGGLWPGVYVLVGGTGSGRSQLTMQMALAAARANVPAAYVGLELDELQLVARVNSLAAYEEGASVPWSHVYLGEQRAPEIKGNWKNWPLHLSTAPPYEGWSSEHLEALAHAVRSHYPEKHTGARPFLLVVDFLQLVDGKDLRGERTLDLRERIGRASYAARTVARDLNAAVVLVSSTAREHYSFDSQDKTDAFGSVDPRKFIGMGKESGEIEYAADYVLVLGRTGEPLPDSGTIPLALGVAKARARSKHAARSAYVHLSFDGTYFKEATPPPRKFDAGKKAPPEPKRRGGRKGVRRDI